ncbi:effector-associated domain 2-containing protein [Streptomyces plumbiresistens]
MHRVDVMPWRTERLVERLLVESLADIPGLQSRQGRLDLIDDVGPPLRGAVREHDRARDHLREVVRTGRRTRALAPLRDVLLEREPDDGDAQWFALVVTVLTAPSGPLPADYMLMLVCELRERTPEFGMSAVSIYATERRRDGRPLDARTLPVALLRLYDERADTGDPSGSRTRMLRFLELLGEEATAHGQADRLVRLLARAPGRGRGTTGPVADLADPRARVNTGRQVVIQIRVEEAGPPGDENLPFSGRSYSLRGFHYESDGDDGPAFHCATDATEVFRGDELDRRGREFLLAWNEQAEAGRGAEKRYEFLLPDSLLGYPAELWPGGPSGVPLSHSGRVVVRSLDRYDDSTIRARWASRWEALDRDCLPGDALERIGWMSPDPVDGANRPDEPWSCPDGKYPPLRLTDPADVEDWLRDHKDLSCLGLGAPYQLHDPLVREAVRDALMYDGIPVMVWRRDAGDPGALLDALRRGCPPALLAELPDSVHEARRYRRRDPLSVGNHITLLWDDPTCVFRNQNSRLPGTRGTGEGAA